MDAFRVMELFHSFMEGTLYLMTFMYESMG